MCTIGTFWECVADIGAWWNSDWTTPVTANTGEWFSRMADSVFAGISTLLLTPVRFVMDIFLFIGWFLSNLLLIIEYLLSPLIYIFNFLGSIFSSAFLPAEDPTGTIANLSSIGAMFTAIPGWAILAAIFSAAIWIGIFFGALHSFKH